MVTEFYPAICIPSTGLCRIEFAMSLAKLMTVFMQQPVIPNQPRQQAHLRMVQSSGISTNREQLASDSLRDGCSHVCFIDEDMNFDPWTLHRLGRHQQPIVACNYRMRSRGGDFAAMSFDYPHRIQTTATSAGLERCAFIGFGFSLIAREVFEALPHPWFPIHWLEAKGHYTTEDKPFFDAARAAGFDVLVDHEASRGVSHIGNFDYRWNDAAIGPLEDRHVATC